jgi:sec-independent protein translocase protein TatA
MFTGLESPTHLLFVLLIIFLLFGAKRLPELGRSMGRGLREFKEGLNTKEEPHEEKRPPGAIEERPNASSQEEERKIASHTQGSQPTPPR